MKFLTGYNGKNIDIFCSLENMDLLLTVRTILVLKLYETLLEKWQTVFLCYFVLNCPIEAQKVLLTEHALYIARFEPSLIV